MFSKQDISSNQNPELNKTEVSSFWAGLFGGKNTSTPNFNAKDSALNFTAQKVTVTNDDIKAKLAKESAKLNPAIQTTQVKNKVWTEGANNNGYLVTLKAKDVDLPRWGAVDPKTVSREAMEKAVLKMGITNNPNKAAEIVAKIKTDGIQTWTTTKGWREVTPSDYADKDWMNERLDRNSNYAVNISNDDVAKLLAASKEVLGVDFKAPSNVSKSQLKIWGITITGGGLAASIALRGAPILGGGGGGLAAPVLLATAAGLPTAYVASEYLKEVYDNGLRRERTDQLPIPYHPMMMDDAGDAPPIPQSKPTDVAERPETKVWPQPQEAGPLVPVKPDVKPDAKAKPETTVQDLPQPFTPDVPKGTPPTSRQEPPQMPKDILPPIIGAVTATAGKAAADAVNNNTKVERTQPSLPPDPTRLPEGVPEKLIRNPIRPDEIRQNEDIQLQNESAEMLSKAGYKVRHRHNRPISEEDVKNNPLLKIGKQPDFEIEGKIFDHAAPQKETSVRNLITRSLKRDKIDKGQATRFVVNLDKSEITFDQLKDQLEKYPVEGLEELIVIKNGKVVPFYPFEK